MNILRTLFPILLILLVFSACRKDTLVVDETPNPPEPPIIQFEIEVSGEVFNEFGEPIPGATITLGETFATTDDNGYFQVTGLANEKKAILTVEKSDYFAGYPTFYPEEGVGQHVRVELMDRVSAGTINPIDNSLKVVTYGPHQIDFGSATYINTNGDSYSGEVSVFVTYLDPTREDLAQFMPGDLVGVNTDDEEQFLKSYGMLNVELEDTAGNPLTMQGEAEMTMEIPNTLLGNASATIPLWYFNTETGNWIEDGTASLEGNQYIGTVTHFTLWNCDASFDLVTISGTVGTDLDPTTFSIKVIRPNGDFQTTLLNQSLRFEGKVPANEVLTLQVIDHCGNVAYEGQIGPFSEDQNLGTLLTDATDMTVIVISGMAVNCDAQPVTNGYAIISDGVGNTYFSDFDSDGNFSTELAWCDDYDVNITAYDNTANKISETIVMDYDLVVEANTIVTCENAIAGLYLSGPDVNLFIPSVGGIEQTNNQPNNALYTTTLIHDQGNGNKVQYNLTILSWTNDPADPMIQISYELQELGNPDPIYSWIHDNSAVPVYEIYNNQSGEIIDIKYNGVDIIEAFGNGTGGFTHLDHTFRFVGTIN